ncbi:hypothetical protein GGH19_000878 [Coemansia sp. RSA 1807]|nr:hypothetical protein IWW43_003208 [Coemansia sp. RSA 1935]KAJ2577960.1 hypothetical protein GGH19_000878 [Coemansia sp. RSA 1807]
MSNHDPSVSPYENISDWLDNHLIDGIRPVLFVDEGNTRVNPTGTFEPYAGMLLMYYLSGPDTGEEEEEKEEEEEEEEEEEIENRVDSGVDVSSIYTGSTISASGVDVYDGGDDESRKRYLPVQSLD